MIPFNKPYLTGQETYYIADAVAGGKISGNGKYTQLCHTYFETVYGFHKCLLTTSCTDALEMAAILANVGPGDEIIMPSYTFVSTANAFVRQGARIVFCDSRPDHPGIDESKIESLITPKTKAIVPVHYAGVASDMGLIMDIAKRHNLIVIEDAAHAIESYVDLPDGSRKRLGSVGHLGTFSFHETKNISSGEGGLLIINDPNLAARAEIIWEKGTNRAAFFRGEVDKYSWVDVGSSFLPADIIAAFLWAQLENLHHIQKRRIQVWNRYATALKIWASSLQIQLPAVPDFATLNGHMFYLILPNSDLREQFISHLRKAGIQAVSHYLSLHKSAFYADKHRQEELPESDRYTDCLVRLPLFYTLSDAELAHIITQICAFQPKDNYITLEAAR